MRKQRGNILFLILLAVILFAALSYAVTSSVRGGGNNASKESIQARGSAILQYMTLVRTTVQRLVLVNGCTYENLDWRTSKYLRINGGVIDSVSIAPAIPKTGCAVFSDFGGPITPQNFEQYEDPGYTAQMTTANPANWKPGHFGFRWVNRINEGSDEADVNMGASGLPYELCAWLLNPASPPAVLPSETWNAATFANTAPPVITGTNRVGDNAPNLYGDIFSQWTNDYSRVVCGVNMIVLSR